MSRLSKESRIAICKEAIRILNDPDCDDYDLGLCFALQFVLPEFYNKEGVEDVPIHQSRYDGDKVYLDEVKEDFPELTAEATRPVKNDMYWWGSDEERLVALHNAIKTLESC